MRHAPVQGQTASGAAGTGGARGQSGAFTAIGQLVRASLAATAIGDALVGLAVAHLGRWPEARAFWLVPASLCVYHGGMALNDWADREADAREGRARPIARGALSAGTALAIALGLLAAGPFFGFLVAPAVGAWMGGIAALAAAYDLFGRGPVLGPFLLGACRAANLAAGAVAAHALGAEPHAHDGGVLWIALLYGTFVSGVSNLARLEDEEDRAPIGTRPQRALARILNGAWLAVAGTFLAWPPGLEGRGRFLAGFAVAVALALAASARAVLPLYARRAWTRADAGRATGTFLRGLLLLQAAIALPFAFAGPFGVVAVLACLAGYPLARALRRVFPPT